MLTYQIVISQKKTTGDQEVQTMEPDKPVGRKRMAAEARVESCEQDTKKKKKEKVSCEPKWGRG
jgi:hypothetical protein